MIQIKYLHVGVPADHIVKIKQDIVDAWSRECHDAIACRDFERLNSAQYHLIDALKIDDGVASILDDSGF